MKRYIVICLYLSLHFGCSVFRPESQNPYTTSEMSEWSKECRRLKQNQFGDLYDVSFNDLPSQTGKRDAVWYLNLKDIMIPLPAGRYKKVKTLNSPHKNRRQLVFESLDHNLRLNVLIEKGPQMIKDINREIDESPNPRSMKVTRYLYGKYPDAYDIHVDAWTHKISQLNCSLNSSSVKENMRLSKSFLLAAVGMRPSLAYRDLGGLRAISVVEKSSNATFPWPFRTTIYRDHSLIEITYLTRSKSDLDHFMGVFGQLRKHSGPKWPSRHPKWMQKRLTKLAVWGLR